jgi:UDP-glucose 4-epimerase
MEDMKQKMKLGAGRSAMRNQKYADPNKPRCLVTGHKGYIGSRLFDKLKSLGYDTIGIDLKDGHDINSDLNGGMTGDAFHPLYYNFKPEIIFHLACIPRVAYSVEEPVKTMQNNVLATSNVLNFARVVGAKKVIYSGSSSVVGNGDGPASPYGLQKLVSELECKLYSKLYGIDTVTLRYFNVYSPDQKAEGPYATAISNWMEHIRQGKKPFITGDGEQRRDMLNVEDAVSANIFAMNYTAPFAGQNFDVGTGKNGSLNEMKEIAQKHFPDIEFNYVDKRKGDVMMTKARTAPLRKLGWKTKISIKKGINECFANLKEK